MGRLIVLGFSDGVGALVAAMGAPRVPSRLVDLARALEMGEDPADHRDREGESLALVEDDRQFLLAEVGVALTELAHSDRLLSRPRRSSRGVGAARAVLKALQPCWVEALVPAIEG